MEDKDLARNLLDQINFLKKICSYCFIVWKKQTILQPINVKPEDAINVEKTTIKILH